MTGLSDYDVMWRRLENWGRWGRQDTCRPDPESVTGSIYEMGRANRHGDDDDAPADPLPAPIDSADAWAIDKLLRRISYVHLVCIRKRFYLRQSVFRPLLDEAVRAACDADV